MAFLALLALLAPLAPQSRPLLRASHLLFATLPLQVTQKISAPLAVVSGGPSTSSRVSNLVVLTVAHPHSLCCPHVLEPAPLPAVAGSLSPPWWLPGATLASMMLLHVERLLSCHILQLLSQGFVGTWSGLRGLALSWQSHLFGDITSKAHRVKSLLWENSSPFFAHSFMI